MMQPRVGVFSLTRRTLSGPRWTWRVRSPKDSQQVQGTQEVQHPLSYLTRQVHTLGPFSDPIRPSWFLPLMFFVLPECTCTCTFPAGKSRPNFFMVRMILAWHGLDFPRSFHWTWLQHSEQAFSKLSFLHSIWTCQNKWSCVRNMTISFHLQVPYTRTALSCVLWNVRINGDTLRAWPRCP